MLFLYWVACQSNRNVLPATVSRHRLGCCEHRGALDVRVGEGDNRHTLFVLIDPERCIRPGDVVSLSVDTTTAQSFDANSEKPLL